MNAESEWGKEQEARIEAEEEAEAKRHGVSVEDLRSAKRFNMSPAEFVSYSGVHNVNAAAALDDELRAVAAAKKDAAHQRRVEEMRT